MNSLQKVQPFRDFVFVYYTLPIIGNAIICAEYASELLSKKPQSAYVHKRQLFIREFLFKNDPKNLSLPNSMWLTTNPKVVQATTDPQKCLFGGLRNSIIM